MPSGRAVVARMFTVGGVAGTRRHNRYSAVRLGNNSAMGTATPSPQRCAHRSDAEGRGNG